MIATVSKLKSAYFKGRNTSANPLEATPLI